MKINTEKIGGIPRTTDRIDPITPAAIATTIVSQTRQVEPRDASRCPRRPIAQSVDRTLQPDQTRATHAREQQSDPTHLRRLAGATQPPYLQGGGEHQRRNKVPKRKHNPVHRPGQPAEISIVGLQRSFVVKRIHPRPRLRQHQRRFLKQHLERLEEISRIRPVDRAVVAA